MEDIAQHGRDSLNLAEIPITTLADRIPVGVNTLTFKTDGGQLTVMACSEYGLPRAVDSDILVALMCLTKRANDFTDPVVNFTKYQIIDLLRWKKDGKNYQRIGDGLNRWMGVTLKYEGCWFDNSIKRKVDASFHILESVVTYDREIRAHARTLQRELPFGQFSWNKIFFESCRANYVKRLDIDTYFSLKSSTSRQCMRFLDKRFYLRNTWTFGLREFAFENVGLSRKHKDGDLRKALQIAFDELLDVGFLKSAEFVSVRRGEWRIRVVGKGRQAGDVICADVSMLL
jgi:plasmid replication initiation protein